MQTTIIRIMITPIIATTTIITVIIIAINIVITATIMEITVIITAITATLNNSQKNTML